MTARREAPEFALLTSRCKALVRKIGNTEDHKVSSTTGRTGPGWYKLEDAGWVSIREDFFGGYTVCFTLTGWERWCRQCDAEGRQPLQTIEFDT